MDPVETPNKLTYDNCMNINQLVKLKIVSKGVKKVTVLDITDGDTLWFGLCFNGLNVRFKLRLARIDTKEKKSKDANDRLLAEQATKLLSDICLGKEVYIDFIKLGGFKRFIGELWSPESDWNPEEFKKMYGEIGSIIDDKKCINVSNYMLHKGLAVLYKR